MITVALVITVLGKPEYWGDWRFVQLPQKGEEITIDRKGDRHYATVERIEHMPAPVDEESWQPIIYVIASFIGTEIEERF